MEKLDPTMAVFSEDRMSSENFLLNAVIRSIGSQMKNFVNVGLKPSIPMAQIILNPPIGGRHRITQSSGGSRGKEETILIASSSL